MRGIVLGVTDCIKIIYYLHQGEMEQNQASTVLEQIKDRLQNTSWMSEEQRLYIDMVTQQLIDQKRQEINTSEIDFEDDYDEESYDESFDDEEVQLSMNNDYDETPP